jgi:hypothetical protein
MLNRVARGCAVALVSWTAAVGALGCDDSMLPPGRRADTNIDAGPDGNRDAGPVSVTGLPCDVTNVLATHCVSCHGAVPSGGATMPLRSYADLVAMSASHPTETQAARSIVRMHDTTTPMPPRPASAVPAADIAVFEAWVAAGTPMGSCMGPTDPFDVPPMCTSGMTWPYPTGDVSRSLRPSMFPGRACLTCHQAENEGFFGAGIVAGTVFPSGHEPDNCNGGAPSGGPVDVEITGADGVVTHLTPNAVGNFYTTRRVATPYTARVTHDGRARVMVTPQTDGDCNSCHTQGGAGTPPAPGRILLP